jgi:hypothetical protein
LHWSYEKISSGAQRPDRTGIDGPPAGFRGEVTKVDEQIAKVAVQVFGRVTTMDLVLGQIELVPDNSN